MLPTGLLTILPKGGFKSKGTLSGLFCFLIYGFSLRLCKRTKGSNITKSSTIILNGTGGDPSKSYRACVSVLAMTTLDKGVGHARSRL